MVVSASAAFVSCAFAAMVVAAPAPVAAIGPLSVQFGRISGLSIIIHHCVDVMQVFFKKNFGSGFHTISIRGVWGDILECGNGRRDGGAGRMFFCPPCLVRS